MQREYLQMTVRGRRGAMEHRLRNVRLIDANAELRRLALTLMAEADSETLREAAGGRSYRQGDALVLLAEAQPADLMVASYAVGEIAEGELARFARLLWAATAGALVVIEPGTPAGYGRILHMRGELIAGESRRVGPSKNHIGTFGTLVPTIHKLTPYSAAGGIFLSWNPRSIIAYVSRTRMWVATSFSVRPNLPRPARRTR